MLVFVLNQAQKANTGKIQTPVYENVREFGKGPSVGFLATLLFSLPRKQESLDDVSFPAEKAL